MDEEQLQRVADHLAIQKVLATYCRAVDRYDSELLKSVYWPDAVDNHGVFNGNALEFVEYVMPALRQMRQTMHQISNVLIDLDGDRARVETYVCASHLVQEGADLSDSATCPRTNADVPDARYWHFMLHNNWFVSLDYVSHQSALNGRQLHIDADGKVRLVIAHQDPGVPN